MRRKDREITDPERIDGIIGACDCIRLGIAAEGALPYPPGVLCIVPGEVWGGAALQYFRALEEGVNELPGFEPEIQGVYWERDEAGRKYALAYVVKQ